MQGGPAPKLGRENDRIQYSEMPVNVPVHHDTQ